VRRNREIFLAYFGVENITGLEITDMYIYKPWKEIRRNYE
jgi:hypothetical protein